MRMSRLAAAVLLAGGLLLGVTVGPAVAAQPQQSIQLDPQAVPLEPMQGSDSSGSSSGTSSGNGSSGSGSSSGSSSGDSSGSGSSSGSSSGSGSSDGNSSGSSSGSSGTTGPSGPDREEPEPSRRPEPSTAPEPSAAEARAEAAAAAAKAQERAAKAAAQFAAARQRAATSWARRGRPARMLIIRHNSVDVVSGGRLTTQTPRGGGVMTLGALDRMAPDSWVTMAGDTARLSAVVVLGPGSVLDVSGVRTLRLTGGPTAPDASAIHTGSGRLIAKAVTITSVDQSSDQPMPPAAGRPYVLVANGGRLDATDATFSDLGTLPDDPENHTGVQFNPGSSGSLVRTTMARNSVGVRLSGSRDIRLDGLALEENVGDGLVMQGDVGTTMRGVRAQRNGGHGVLFQSTDADRVISEITTTGNKQFGLAVVGLVRPRITGVTTTADAGGLRLNHVSQPLVTDFTAIDQPIGIFTHVGSTGMVFDRARIVGGRRGMVIEKSTTGLEIKNSSVERSSSVGVSLGGREITMNGLSVSGSRTAVRVERGAAGITANGLALSGGQDGFVANPGSSRVVLRDLVANGIGNDAVRTYSPDTQIMGARITGADTGIVGTAATAVADAAITKVEVGLRSRGGVPMTAERVDVAALTVGIDAAPGSPVDLRESKVHALQALRGEVRMVGFNDLSLPPLNLLGAIGAPLIILALGLELVHAVRQRRFKPGAGRRLPPLPAVAGA